MEEEEEGLLREPHKEGWLANGFGPNTETRPASNIRGTMNNKSFKDEDGFEAHLSPQ